MPYDGRYILTMQCNKCSGRLTLQAGNFEKCRQEAKERKWSLNPLTGDVRCGVCSSLPLQKKAES